MLKKPQKTRDFRAWLYGRLSTLLPTSRQEIARHADLIDKMYLLDFDPAMDVIVSRYSTTGTPARDPSAMLRALLLAGDLGIQSITRLVSHLRSSEVLAIASGFDPDDVPGVGTFYDFMYRLWGEDKKRFARRTKQYRSHRNKDPKPLVDGPASKRHERLSESLAKAVIENSFPLDPEAFTLARIFDWCFVARSEEMGILESPTRKGILLSGDGTLIRSGASRHGIKDCDCRTRGVRKCDCPRRF